MTRRRGGCAAVAALFAALLAGCGEDAGARTDAGAAATHSDSATAISLADFGGMDGLIAAARKEGTLNVTTVPRGWVNYGAIIDAFSAKYGIRVESEDPDGSSQDEIDAVRQRKGQPGAPDVLDLGQSFAVTGQQLGLLAPYKVATWDRIPESAKARDSTWYSGYGGYVAIGYDTQRVKTAPTSFADLLKPEFKGQVAINGNPTKAGGAFSAVYAAALANGGSFDNVQPGIDYFAKLARSGNLVRVTGGPATVQDGSTPVLIWWDYLQSAPAMRQLPTWKVVIPSDSRFAGYYAQAINRSAPHPAAARLWEEFLYSVEGQNLWLAGRARPIELPALLADGTADTTALAGLPVQPEGEPVFPSIAQQDKAKALINQKWAAAVG